MTDPTGGWQLDEAGATAYERDLVPRILGPHAAELLGSVSIDPAASVLDVACGTGIVARHAAALLGPDGEVDAVDVSPAMLSVARDLVSEAGVPIRLKEASADDLPFPDDSFDVVLCHQGLQFFPDRRVALEEMRRVLRPGGRLGLGLCRSLEFQPGYQVLVDVVTRHLGVEAADILCSPYAFGDAERARRLATDAGFGDVHVRFVVRATRFPSPGELLRAETSGSPVGALIRSLDPDVVGALVDELTRALRPRTDDEGVVFPFESIVLTATR